MPIWTGIYYNFAQQYLKVQISIKYDGGRKSLKDQKLVPKLILFLSLYEGLENQQSWAITGKVVTIALRLLDKIPVGLLYFYIFIVHFMTLFGKWSEKAAGSRRGWLIFGRLAPKPDKESNKCKLFVTFNNCVGPHCGVDGLQEKENVYHSSRQEPERTTF